MDYMQTEGREEKQEEEEEAVVVESTIQKPECRRRSRPRPTLSSSLLLESFSITRGLFLPVIVWKTEFSTNSIHDV